MNVHMQLSFFMTGIGRRVMGNPCNVELQFQLIAFEYLLWKAIWTLYEECAMDAMSEGVVIFSFRIRICMYNLYICIQYMYLVFFCEFLRTSTVAVGMDAWWKPR